MGLNYSHGQTVRNFREWITEITDDDLSERADRVLKQARTPGFGFKDQSGDLRRSIVKRKISRNPRVPGYRIVAGEGALNNDGNSYALAVEKGHPKRGRKAGSGVGSAGTVAARPFLRPSLRAGRD
jgi:hypothetical protein